MNFLSSPFQPSPQNLPRGFALIVTAILGICLQILVTLPLGAAGIRVALADTVIIPLAVVLAIWALKRDGDFLPVFARRPMLLMLGALTTAITFSLILGRVDTGEWLPWPLVNKWGGWWVLLIYLCVGAWTRRFCEEAHLETGLRAIFLFSYLSVLFSLIAYELFLLGVGDISYPRLSGFFANPNAYGCALAVFIMVQLDHLWADRLFPWWLHIVGIGILVTGLVLSGSRSAWIGSAAGFLCLLVLRKIRLRDTLAVVAAASALLLAIFGAPILVTAISNKLDSGETGEATQYFDLGEAIRQLDTRTYITRNYSDSGISHRIKISEKAVEYWKESPILGIGLGTFYHRVTEEKEISPATIHTTALWLLTETGILGLLCFTAFLAFVTTALIRKARSPDSDGGSLEYGVAAAVVVVAAASIGTELLYQRHIWWFVGLALAYRPSSSEFTQDSVR